LADGEFSAALPKASADMGVHDAETELGAGRHWQRFCQWPGPLSKMADNSFHGK
jgi:hypothetical protein